MLVEAKQAFYNEETGAVQPWRDIEVDDTLGNELVGEGLVAAIAAGGGGGGDYKTANVTIIGDNGGEKWSFELDAITDDSGNYSCVFEDNGYFSLRLFTNDGDPVTTKIIYQGDSAVVSPYNHFVSATGDAVYDSETGYITITGDCTITGYEND